MITEYVSKSWDLAEISKAIDLQRGAEVLYFGEPLTRRPEAPVKRDSLHSRLVCAELPSGAVFALTRMAAYRIRDYCARDLGLVQSPALAWFDGAAAPRVLGLFDPQEGTHGTIWLSSALLKNFSELGVTISHEAMHACHFEVDSPLSDADREASADAYARKFAERVSLYFGPPNGVLVYER